MSSRLACLLALTLGVLAVSSSAQDDLDPRTKQRIEDTEKKLAEARDALERAHLALQDVYQKLSDTWLSAAARQSPEVVEDLGRVLEGAVAAAEAEASRGGNARRIAALFERELGKGLRRAEIPLVRVLGPRIQSIAVESLGEDPRRLLDTGLAGVVAAVEDGLFAPDLPFAKVWNETVADRVDETGRYVEVRRLVEDLDSRLEVLRDPRLAFAVEAPPGMARIPAQSVTVASSEGYAADKKRRARVAEFDIDVREVTHGDFWRLFWSRLEDPAARQEHLPRGEDDRPLWFQSPETGEYRPAPDMLDLPVVGIDFRTAHAYAVSQGKRLPTEAEWLAAASATGKGLLKYTWGDEWKESFCASSEGDRKTPAPVGSFPQGRSFFGVHDLCGNVKEWLATTAEGRDFEGATPPAGNLVIRGGSFRENRVGVSLDWRWILPGLATRLEDVGFRCAADTR